MGRISYYIWKLLLLGGGGADAEVFGIDGAFIALEGSLRDDFALALSDNLAV